MSSFSQRSQLFLAPPNLTYCEARMKSEIKDNSNLFELYEMMRRIRTFEERVGELFVRGLSAGSMLHLSIGEESAAAGIGSLMRVGDRFTTHHRGHGIFLARGANPDLMMAEIAGREQGYCHGKGGSMHIADMGLGHLGANAIVGGGIPAVVGAALKSKRQGAGDLSIAFFGDGAVQQGVLYESMNLAAVWDLPVVFVSINNQYGMGTHISQATRGFPLHARAQALGLNGDTIDGLDVREVVTKSSAIMDDARGGKPGFIAIDCYRFYGHARMDKSPYRSEEDELLGRAKDPVLFARNALIEGGMKANALEDLDATISKEMDRSIEFAANGTEPQLSSMFKDVYDPLQPEPEPVRTRIERVLATK